MNNLELLIPKAPVEKNKYAWATVTGVSPLRIRLDGEAEPLPFSPDVLEYGLKVNDRVWCQIFGRQVVILGKTGGQPAPAPTPPYVPPADIGGLMNGSNASNVLLASGVWTRIIWWSVERLTGGMQSSSWNFVVPVEGWYTATAGIRLGTSTSARRGFAIDVTSSATAAFTNRHYRMQNADNSTFSNYQIARNVYCKAGEHVRFWVYQDTGANIEASVNPDHTFFSVVKAGK